MGRAAQAVGASPMQADVDQEHESAGPALVQSRLSWRSAQSNVPEQSSYAQEQPGTPLSPGEQEFSPPRQALPTKQPAAAQPG